MDLSEAMLAWTREACERAGVREHVEPDAYDLVINIYTSFGYFTDAGENLDAGARCGARRCTPRFTAPPSCAPCSSRPGSPVSSASRLRRFALRQPRPPVDRAGRPRLTGRSGGAGEAGALAAGEHELAQAAAGGIIPVVEVAERVGTAG
ncbi:hypothetical protein LZG04_16355 [Saccharothrix sp. S26]|uniref:hypothetical protein n=1 Tax=Saccharothrix sp. S26 TaxID=2907215 RepID=UPI001F2D1B53|nr:hypothetical protein [Saccharothrix sp. S26]MCE6996358.1 hypothetical protein [Saccharothrix sp. S26]